MAARSGESAVRRTSVTTVPERPESKFERQGNHEMGGPLTEELDLGSDSGSTAGSAGLTEGQGAERRSVRSGTTHVGKLLYWNALEARTAGWVNKIQVFLSLVNQRLNINPA